jgi:hypothetical protein
MGGNPFVSVMMLSWIPLVLYFFSRYPAQKALIVSFIFAWLFLPVATFVLPGIPDYTKISATVYGILLATAIFDSSRFSSFRLSWIDVPILCLALISPLMSSISNGLGAYDGFAVALDKLMAWGGPYFLGRLYLTNLAALKQLAIGIFLGGLIYIPFCWFESRTFTSLHVLVYGMDTGRDASQSIRYGGYRPQVFLEHGLMLGIWMMTACMMGMTLWKTKILKQVGNQPIGLMFVMLLITFIIAKSTGAYMLFMLGAIIMFMAWQFRTAMVMWILIGGMLFYLYMGVTGTFPNKPIVGALSQVFNEERVGSVKFRFDNEEILGAKARQSLVWGWGGYNRNRVFDEYGKDTTVTDSLWIIAFGINGAFGLISMTAAILLPVLSFVVRYPARTWSNPNVAPAATLAVCIVLYMLDCLLNAMVNPIFMLAAGGLATVALQPRQLSSKASSNQLART